MLGWIQLSNSSSKVVGSIHSPTSNVSVTPHSHLFLTLSIILFRALHFDPLFFRRVCIHFFLGRGRENGPEKNGEVRNLDTLLRLPAVHEIRSSRISQNNNAHLLFPSSSLCWLETSLTHLHTCPSHLVQPRNTQPEALCALENLWLKVS